MNTAKAGGSDSSGSSGGSSGSVPSWTGNGGSSSATDSLNGGTPIHGSIQIIADYGTGPAALRARNFLRFFYHEAYEDLPTFPSDTSRRDRRSPVSSRPQQKNKGNNVKVYPNPANDLVTLEYQLASTTDVASVVVINELGQQMYSGSVSGGQGIQNINIRSWSPGLYLYKVNSGQGFESSGSFVVNH